MTASRLPWSTIKAATFWTSFSEIYGPCTRVIFEDLEDRNNISPALNNFSAPEVSITVLESTCEETWNVILVGTLALIKPVMTSTDGLCVASTKWIPVALAI